MSEGTKERRREGEKQRRRDGEKERKRQGEKAVCQGGQGGGDFGRGARRRALGDAATRRATTRARSDGTISKSNCSSDMSSVTVVFLLPSASSRRSTENDARHDSKPALVFLPPAGNRMKGNAAHRPIDRPPQVTGAMWRPLARGAEGKGRGGRERARRPLSKATQSHLRGRASQERHVDVDVKECARPGRVAREARSRRQPTTMRLRDWVNL